MDGMVVPTFPTLQDLGCDLRSEAVTPGCQRLV